MNARLYLLAVIAVAPALVFNASRISNDVVLIFLEFLWLALLLQFWKQPTWPSWLALSLVLGLALLTKASALALIPISLASLWLVPAWPVKSKVCHAVAFLAAALAISGGYYFPRAFHQSGVDSYLVGNIHRLNPKGHINGVLLKSLVFNPFKVLRYPFVDPWGPRHEYFLEYFFKSIFVGEWLLGNSYRWVARALVATAFLLVPVFLRGIWRSIRDETAHSRPMLLLFGAIFLAQWSFVQVAPFMSSQDFRYSVILLVPIVYYFDRGLADWPVRWRQAGFLGLQLLILNSAIYLLELAFEG